jgi:hypothetical protein
MRQSQSRPKLSALCLTEISPSATFPRTSPGTRRGGAAVSAHARTAFVPRPSTGHRAARRCGLRLLRRRGLPGRRQAEERNCRTGLYLFALTVPFRLDSAVSKALTADTRRCLCQRSPHAHLAQQDVPSRCHPFWPEAASKCRKTRWQQAFADRSAHETQTVGSMRMKSRTPDLSPPTPPATLWLPSGRACRSLR